MGKVLSIDYGRKRIGVAVSDEENIFAFSEPVITDTIWSKLYSKLLATIKFHKPTKIVIGYPLGLDMKPTQMSLEVDHFIENLKQEFAIEILKWNEVGTSQLASINFRHKKTQAIDSESARIILKEYLDYINSK